MVTTGYKIFRVMPDTGQLTSAFPRTYRAGLHYPVNCPVTVQPDGAVFYVYESYRTALSIVLDFDYSKAMLDGVKLVLPVSILDEPKSDLVTIADSDPQSMPWTATVLKCKELTVLDTAENRNRYYGDVLEHVVNKFCLGRNRAESTVRQAFLEMRNVKESVGQDGGAN